jgi:hypothetical protein
VVAPDIVGAERRLNEIGAGKRAAAPTRSRVTKMADQAPEFDGRARADLPPGIFGMMAVLVTATVIAILYFAREVFVPITLAVLLSCGLGHRQTDGGRVLADQFPQATDHHRPSGNGGVHLRGCLNSE